MTKKKHIIFDMDGTLSDTAKATLAAIKKAEKLFKLPPVTENSIRDAMGIAGLDFYRHILPNVPDDVLIKLEPEVDALELAVIQDLGPEILFPGVADLLVSLKQANTNLYIASTGSEVHVHGTLQATGIKSYFSGIYCGESAKIDMVRRIIAGSDPDEWAMIGDMFKDSEAARGNGILALGAEFGYLAKEDYSLFDAVLRTPEDLLVYIDSELEETLC